MGDDKDERWKRGREDEEGEGEEDGLRKVTSPTAILTILDFSLLILFLIASYPKTSTRLKRDSLLRKK